jgi:uncharacterized protein (DUF4415 family)
MSRERTPISLRKGIKISAEIRRLYEKRNRALDNDPDVPTLPPDMWANAARRDEYFHPARPIKHPVTLRIDKDVLEWLKSEGEEGYTTRLNAILREKMLSVSAAQQPQQPPTAPKKNPRRRSAK